jgi:hypothetical protein
MKQTRQKEEKESWKNINPRKDFTNNNDPLQNGWSLGFL